MKPRFFLLISLLFISLCLTGCGHAGYAGPEKAVSNELNLIQQMDSETIQNYFSDLYGDKIPDDAIDGINLFFQNYKYDIKSSKLSSDGESATVTVSIEHLDTKSFARELCFTMLRETTSFHQDNSGNDIAAYFRLFKQCLTDHTYSTVKSTVTFPVIKQDGEWQIENSPELSDAIAGNLTTYLSDPDLLSPDEVLDITLDQFRHFSSEDWIQYLNIDNLFSVASSSYKDIDQRFTEQLSSYFDYTIKESRKDGEHAHVTASITSLDLQAIMADCNNALMEYAASTESVRASDEELSDKITSILLEAITNNTASRETDVDFRIIQGDSFWEAILDSNFTDALLGDLSESLDQLHIETAVE